MENIVIAMSALALPGTARHGRCCDKAISYNMMGMASDWVSIRPLHTALRSVQGKNAQGYSTTSPHNDINNL